MMNRADALSFAKTSASVAIDCRADYGGLGDSIASNRENIRDTLNEHGAQEFEAECFDLYDAEIARLRPAVEEAEGLLQELDQVGDVRQGNAVLTKDGEGYHMRDVRNIFGKFRHDLPADASAERVATHWAGFVANMRAEESTRQAAGKIRIERQFNRTSAKGVDVAAPAITTGSGASALGVRVRFQATDALEGLAVHLTPDAAFELGQRLILAADQARGA